MFRFLYYKGLIDLLDLNMLLELNRDICLDYEQDILEEHQHDYLINKLQNKLNNNKILYI